MGGRHNETLLVKYDPSALKEEYVQDKYQERNRSLQYGHSIRRREEIYDRIVGARANSVGRHFVNMLADERTLNITHSLDDEDASRELIYRELVIHALGSYKLRAPVEVVESFSNGVYCINCEELESVGCGHNRSSALSDFMENLDAAIDLYADANDDQISEGALRLKRDLNSKLYLG